MRDKSNEDPRIVLRAMYGRNADDIDVVVNEKSYQMTSLAYADSNQNVNEVPARRGLLATDHVILNHGQVTWTTPELAPPLLTTTPHQREDVSALDRFNVHRCATRRVLSGTGIELMTCLPWLDTLTTGLPQPHFSGEGE
ncbi:uncharacterized protein TNCV_4582401 [Trichonephila clavipes]|nr:uncharacterized protein TNCV_4582401 [Trichonephila clavipes]